MTRQTAPELTAVQWPEMPVWRSETSRAAKAVSSEINEKPPSGCGGGGETQSRRRRASLRKLLRCLGGIAVLVTWAAGLLVADEQLPDSRALATALEVKRPSADDSETAEVTLPASELARLIRELDAEQFAVRNDATRQLVAQGPHCLPQLTMALAPNREKFVFASRRFCGIAFRLIKLPRP